MISLNFVAPYQNAISSDMPKVRGTAELYDGRAETDRSMLIGADATCTPL